MAAKKDNSKKYKSFNRPQSANAAEKRVMDGKKLRKDYLSEQNKIAEVGMRAEASAPSVAKMSVPMYKKYNVKSDKEITPAKYKALLADVKKLEMAAAKVRGRRGR